MKTKMIPPGFNLLAAALALLLGMTALTAAADKKAKEQDGREVLSKHATVAQFAGVAYHRCLGMTSECPDKCGSSGDMATFRVLKYVAYEKPGEYGDEKQQEYQFLVQDNLKQAKVPAAVKATMDTLQPDDYVLLDWQHDYVTKAGSKFPERTVTKLQRITREEADKLTGGLDKLPKREAAPKVQQRAR